MPGPCPLHPASHDRALATISHLPHVLAAALTLQAESLLPMAAGSMHGAARVAAGDPALPTAMVELNREAVEAAIDHLVRTLDRFRADDDPSRWFTSARPCGAASATAPWSPSSARSPPVALRAVGEVGGHVTGLGEDTLHGRGAGMSEREPFQVPPYPYDRLGDLAAAAAALPGGAVDLSIGTPCDPPPDFVVEALARSGAERGYPPSIGTQRLPRGGRGLDGAPARRRRSTRLTWPRASAPRSWWPRCRSTCASARPDRDTVLHPELAYPTYAMGAYARRLPRRRLRATSTTSTPPTPPGPCACGSTPRPTPTAPCVDLGEAAAWGRERGVPVLSDECYVEFTWAGGGAGRTILEHGTDGVLAVHSLSKRSNLAGARAGVYAGDAELVRFLGRGPQARRAHGARARCRRPRSRRGATTPTSTPSARSTGAASSGCARCWPPLGRRGAAARRRLLPLGAGAARATRWALAARLAAEPAA